MFPLALPSAILAKAFRQPSASSGRTANYAASTELNTAALGIGKVAVAFFIPGRAARFGGG